MFTVLLFQKIRFSSFPFSYSLSPSFYNFSNNIYLSFSPSQSMSMLLKIYNTNRSCFAIHFLFLFFFENVQHYDLKLNRNSIESFEADVCVVRWERVANYRFGWVDKGVMQNYLEVFYFIFYAFLDSAYWMNEHVKLQEDWKLLSI